VCSEIADALETLAREWLSLLLARSLYLWLCVSAFTALCANTLTHKLAAPWRRTGWRPLLKAT